MVVVDLGGGLAAVRAEDAAGVLDEPSFLGDGRGEEEGVQRRAVESFPGVRAGRHDMRPAQTSSARLRQDAAWYGTPVRLSPGRRHAQCQLEEER